MNQYLPYARFIVLWTLPIAYGVAFVFNVYYCKPANISEFFGSVLLSLMLAVMAFPLTWIAVLTVAVIIAVPLIFAAKQYAKRTGKTEAEIWHRIWHPAKITEGESDIVDAEVSELRDVPRIQNRPRSISRKPDLLPDTRKKLPKTSDPNRLPKKVDQQEG